MRRILLVGLGLLEIVAAGLLLFVTTLLPTEIDLRGPVGRVERLSERAENQLGQLRDRVGALREKKPAIRAAARELRDNTQAFTDALTSHVVDFVTLQNIGDSLSDVATGLDSVREHLRPEAGKQLKNTLKTAADLLESKLGKPAEEAANYLDQTAAAIRSDSGTLLRLLRLAAPDLKAAVIADELPKLATTLARLLRESAQLKEVVTLLRQGEENLGPAIANWPKVQTSLTRAAEVLRKTQEQLGRAIGNKDEYEQAVKASAMVARTFTAALPALADQLEVDLTHQEESLDELRGNLEQIRGRMPGFADGLVSLVRVAWWLLWLVAGILLLAGVSCLLPPAEGNPVTTPGY